MLLFHNFSAESWPFIPHLMVVSAQAMDQWHFEGAFRAALSHGC